MGLGKHNPWGKIFSEALFLIILPTFSRVIQRTFEITSSYSHSRNDLLKTKGQLVLKGNFGVFDTSKKRNWKFQFLP